MNKKKNSQTETHSQLWPYRRMV